MEIIAAASTNNAFFIFIFLTIKTKSVPKKNYSML
jgi:hypothetical protein